MPPKNKTPPKGAASQPTPKKPRGRPPKSSNSAPTSNQATGTMTDKKKPGRPPKKTLMKGGWIYVADGGTAIESEVVDKGFPWVTKVELDGYRATDFKRYTHRTAILILSGKAALTEESHKFTATGEGPLGGMLDKNSEVFVIDARVDYKVTALAKRCKYLLGLEVLDQETRDEMIERREIEWDGEMEADSVGPVTAEVRAEGDVGDISEGEDGVESKMKQEEKEEENEPAPSRFKHGDAEEKEVPGEGESKEDAGDEGVDKEGDMEESEVETLPTKKSAKAKVGKK